MNDANHQHSGGPDKPLREVTHKIKQWRNFNKLSLQQLGDEAKLTPSLISQIELGRSALASASSEFWL
jgi:transcriptional regulator with XRE-family HTH domain